MGNVPKGLRHSRAADLGEYLGNAVAQYRVDEVRGQLGQRNQHERPLVEPGMRYLKPGAADNLAAAEQDVDVNGP